MSQTLQKDYQNAAVIDIGSNLIRMAVAEVRPDGHFDLIEKLQRAVWLGQDTFQRGRLGRQTIRAAISVMRDFQRQLDFYGIKHCRAVATSAVREALNADAFIDRIYMATGIDVEVIDTTEESRLTVAGLLHSLPKRMVPVWKKVLVAEVGGGSTLLTMLQGSEIMASQSLPLGSVRMKEVMLTSQESPAQAADILKLRIANELKTNLSLMPDLDDAETLIVMGGDARFIARRLNVSATASGMTKLTAKSLNAFLDRYYAHSPEELAAEFHLAFADAQTLIPALLVYRAILKTTGLKELRVFPTTMRDGLLVDLSQRLTGLEDLSLSQGVVHSAEMIARKYQTDIAHAYHVTHLALALFDALQNEHRLASHHRILLHIAGLLHDIGHFVSPRAHHKHSYYLMVNSEIFGFSRDELITTALVARYHRRSIPKSSHTEYITLSRERRMVISKLAALLRIADALDVSHRQTIKSFRCERQEDDLVLVIPNVTDLSLERRALAFKCDLFMDIFGMRVRLEEEWPSQMNIRRAEPMTE